jgi:hypothetical protein
MGTKQLGSSARNFTCTSVDGGHKVPAMEHPPYFPDLSSPDFFLFLRPKSNLKVQQFATAEKVTAQATRALTEVSKNRFQDCSQKLYER